MSSTAGSRPPIELHAQYRNANAFFAEYLKHICRGETFIKTPRPLPIGTAFVFHLHIERLPEPISLEGTVAWTTSPPAAGASAEPDSGMGIRFTFASDAARTGLYARIEQLMVDAFGPQLAGQLLAQGA